MSIQLLYIEDDPINAFVMEKLVGRDYSIRHAPDGESGLTILNQFRFDLVLMDIHLGNGKMDGIETMKQLKRTLGYERVPVIAVTSYALPEDEKRFRLEGFDDYLPKPIDRSLLLQRIKQLLAR